MSKKTNKFIVDDCVLQYFKDVRKTTIISQEEELKLSDRIKNGDKKAIDTLIKSNLKFVVSIAKEYQGHGIDLSDLISEGNYGLVKAASKFDPTKGVKFISYAVWWIRQSIMQSLNDNARLVRLPVNVIQKLAETRKEVERFESANQRSPVYGELAINSQHQAMFNQYQKNVPFNNNVDPEEIFIDSYSEDEEPEDSDRVFNIKRELEKTLLTLDERSKEIIELYYGLNDSDVMTLEQIGERYQLTKERVRQIKEKAIRKLKNESEGLFNLLNH
jgi:RNA polymerase primary sigma factor